MALIVEAMVQTTFDLDRPVRAEFLGAIHGLTDGNPFFIEETLKSLVAALDPAHVAYLYYVADSSGHNHYATTYQEFLQLKAKYVG